MATAEGDGTVTTRDGTNGTISGEFGGSWTATLANGDVTLEGRAGTDGFVNGTATFGGATGSFSGFDVEAASVGTFSGDNDEDMAFAGVWFTQ